MGETTEQSSGHDGSEERDGGCEGEGRCHGPMSWCASCGDVKHVCDMRLRGERCDAHPLPPTWASLRVQRSQAERTIQAGQELVREGKRVLNAVEEDERARRAFDAQQQAADDALWPGFAKK